MSVLVSPLKSVIMEDQGQALPLESPKLVGRTGSHPIQMALPRAFSQPYCNCSETKPGLTAVA